MLALKRYMLMSILGIVNVHLSCGGERGKLSGKIRINKVFRDAYVRWIFLHFLDKIK